MAGNFTLLRCFYIIGFKYFCRFLRAYQKRKMPSNVEIKATVQDYDKFRSLAENISGQEGQLILQEDIFFHVPNGRLKLRILQDRPSQLISYSRSDQSGPKLSEYYITEIPKPEDLKKTLGTALGIKGVVKKERLLFLVGQTRVHLDKVENLGCFMELEVVLRENQTTDEGSEIANDLMAQLKVDKNDLITCAYIDLLSKQEQEKARMYSEIGLISILLFAVGSFAQLPNTVFGNDKLRDDIKKEFHKGYKAALQDTIKGNTKEKRYDIATLNQAARNRNTLLSSFGGDPYGMGSTMLSKQQLTFGRKKRSIVPKTKRYVGASRNALKDAYTSGYKAAKEMLAKIQKENSSPEKRFSIERLNQAARHRNVYLDVTGGDPYGGSSVVASQQHINWNRGKRAAN